MKKLLLLCVALLVVPASAAFAQIDLTWDNCVLQGADTAPPTTDKPLDCAGAASKTYLLHGCFKTPQGFNGNFAAMDISIDLQQETAGNLVPFFRYETGGCNATGRSVTAARSASLGGCSGVPNTPWGNDGEETVFTGITAYAPDFGSPGRGRMLIAIARDGANPTTVAPAPKNYFGFILRINTNNRPGAGMNCAGCTEQAAIVWNSATLFGQNQTVVLTGPSGKPAGASYCATINGVGVNGCTATPTRNTTWGQLKSIYR